MGADRLNFQILEQMKHTPGPWRVDYAMGIRGADNVPLAYVLSDSSSTPTPDARLIAAAPELLEALRECLSIIGKDPRWEWVKTYRQAHDAIAKATSEK